jgi:hypothetical protein
MEQYEVKCNWCDWIGYDDDLKVEVDLSDNLISHDIQYRKVCPECLSEDYLMDVEIVLQNKTKQIKMVQRDFIPYEQALELKELGFDEPCLMYYDYLCTLVESGVYKCKAPLYQQVFRWFREKYGVYFHQKKFDENKWWVEWGDWESPVFETYDELELECVKKLIEIAKL